MSVLINMEMPTSCSLCKLRQAVGCCGNLPHNTRMPNCPLAPVQPHGRLIDADALEAEFKKLVYQDNWYYNALHHAPTIIPAEEGEE